MALSHLKKGLKLGMDNLDITAKKVEAELKPLIRAGHITTKDARSFVSEAVKLGKKSKASMERLAVAQAKKIVQKTGYVSKAEADALRRKIAALEKQLKAKRNR